MKKSSKLVSLILALMLVVSSFTCLASVSASAAEPSTTLIYFKAPSYWGTVKTVFCNLFNVYGGSSIKTPAWQTKSTRCTKVAGTTDLFAYDTSKLVDEDGKSVSIEAGADYALNFSATTKEGDTPQTGDVLLGVECLGDTVYCLGEDKRTENSVDSKKLDYIGGWENNSDQYGAKAVITSTGKIIPPTDSYFPAHQPKAEILSQFLHSYAVKNAEIITSEIVQADCTQIGVAPIDVYNYYADAYASELDDPETYPETASLTTIAALLGVDPTPTTTEEPTTEEPTTAPEPTTEEPTTAPEPTTDPEPTAPVSTYIVAGTENLCGSNWDGSDTNNEMLQNSDGTYSKTYENVDAIGEVQVKVVEHQDGVEDAIWHGYPGDYNVAKIVSSPCDVTVTYNPETGEITLTGAGVEDKKFEVDAMRAVGNGDGTWLNGANWAVDDDANKMEEIADNVYQIKYEDVEEFDTYQVKFAANGSWNDNWGGVFTASGEETDAVYNSSDNITFAVEYELADVTLTIDLTNFNATTKEGAKFKIDIVDATAPASTYIVAGTENLCGSNWDGSDTNNEMLQNSDGTYSKTYENVDAIGEVQVKVVEHQDGVEDAIWHGYPGDYNVAKIVSSPCDVTVTYNPETGEITLTGAGVEDKKFEVDAMRAVGNGDGTWLNGANWAVDDDANKMEEIADNVYQIKYEDVEEFDTYQVKFAANGSWNDNWGGVFTASGEETDAVYNSSDNITFAVEYELADVTLTIDLTNFNATTKEGAKFRIDIVDATPKAGIYGDVNGDGVITIEDASLIQKAGLGIITLDEAQTALADVNGDGRISILDVTLIQKYLAGGYQNTGLVGQTVK